ncbi:hypothetical protein, partial [Rhodovibrio salinarum]
MRWRRYTASIRRRCAGFSCACCAARRRRLRCLR